MSDSANSVPPEPNPPRRREFLGQMLYCYVLIFIYQIRTEFDHTLRQLGRILRRLGQLPLDKIHADSMRFKWLLLFQGSKPLHDILGVDAGVGAVSLNRGQHLI